MDNHYFIVLAFTDDIEKFPHRIGMENYPSFLANYNVDIKAGLIIQSNIYDAIKFTKKEDASLFMSKAEQSMPEWVYEIVDISKRIFGKENHKYVYCKN